MRYEFDHRTGSMQPKKDDNIYFAQSQGGGLIVDDKKNNIRYIIERDDRITKLFGGFDGDSLNFYDMRDARMIADRVVRLFGRNHKYSDFHYFLKGYHMSENFVRSFSGFLDESVWSDIHRRSTGATVRAEDKNVIGVLDDGTKLRVPMDVINGVGELIKFDDGKNYYTLYEGFYLAVINEDGNDVYYVYDPYSEDDYNMIEITRWNGDTFRTRHKFAQLRAVLQSADEEGDGLEPTDLDGLDVTSRDNNSVDVEMDNYDYLIFEDHDSAYNYAVEDVSEFESESLESILHIKNPQEQREKFKDFIDHIRNVCGDDVFDEDELKDVFEETFEFDYDDRDEEDIIDELLNLEIIEDTEEYFDLDEDGDIDHTLPKFDYQNYKDKYVEVMLENVDDFVEEYVSRFGYEGIEKYIDFDDVAEQYVDIDGVGHFLSSYDRKEREVEIDGTTYYIYRRN